MKRIIYLCFFLCLITTVKAQVVTIPDANFKAALIAAGVDTNSDSQIQTSEALAVTSLNLKAASITDVTGVQSFANLTFFGIGNNSVTTLNLSGLVKLVTVDAPFNFITTVDLRNGVTNAISLNLQSNPGLSRICVDPADTVTGGPFPNGIVPAFSSAAPTGNASQSFCFSAKTVVAQLVATGTSIQWYATPTGGVALAPNTLVTNGTHYYASQTAAGACESAARFDVTATVIDPPAPTGNAAQSFCRAASPTVANLTATGTNIKWYTAPTGGAVVGNTTALTNGAHYYASQTDGAGCESSNRFDVTATVNDPVPTGNAAQSFCFSGKPVVAQLAATGTNIKWYAEPKGGVALAPNTLVTNGTHYYASQTDASGCESLTRFDVTATVIDPAAPTGTAAQSFCKAANPTVANLTATGTNIKWYTAPTGGAVIGNTTALANGQHYYASQTDGAGCESSNRFDVTATVNDPAAPTGTSAQSFCLAAAPTVANLAATGTSIKWYADPKATTALASTTPLTNGTHYYASQTVGGCESVARFDVTATVNGITPPATAASPQAFCNAATVADLQATGTAIKWYIVPGSLPLASTVPLVTRTFYVTQTINGCESVLTPIAVAVNVTPPPTTVNQAFCTGATVADLKAVGTDVKWYIVPGSLPLDSTIPLVNGTFYATQTLNGCESALTPISVAVITTAAPTAPTIQAFCNSAIVANLVATGTNIRWYDDATGGTALAATTPLATGTYYASQTATACESTARKAVFVIINSVPIPPPTAPSPQAFCGGATVADLQATGIGIKWYLIPGSVALDPTTPLITHSYLVTQSLGTCESAPTTIQVTVSTPAPTAPTPQIFCNAATVADLQATGTNIKWYIVPGSVALAPTIPLVTRTYYVTQTANGCESALTPVAVTVNITPAPTAASPQSFCGAATVANLQATGTAIKWYIVPGSVALDPTIPLVTRTYYVTQTLNGCESALTEVAVTVNGTTPPPTAPSPQAFCGAATVADLQATGTAIKWYIVPGSVALDSTDPLITHSYLATQTINGCESVATTVAVTVNGITPPPSAPSPQTFCGAATVADLAASGTNIKWYIVPGSVALEPTIPLVTRTYLVTQTINGCESAAVEVAVTVNGTTPPPTAASPQAFCGAATVADLKATGTAIKWYLIPGSVALDSSTPLITHSYLATQTINGCESAATTIEVTVGTTPPPTAPSPQTFCGAATVADLKATGTAIKWYLIPGSVALDSSIPLITHDYLVTQTINGCESAAITVAVTVGAGITPPIIGAIKQPTCAVAGSVVLSGLPAGNWVISQTGTVSNTITGSTSSVIVSDLAAGTYYFSVTNSGGCASGLSEPVVMVKPVAPSAPLVGAITQPTCSKLGTVLLYGLPDGNWTIARHTVGVEGDSDLVYYYGSTNQYLVTGLTEGIYRFDVSDITYCTSKKSVKVVINAGLAAPSAPVVGTITQPATCSQTGSVVLTGLPAGNWTITQHTEGESDLVYYYGSTSQYTVTGLSQGTYRFDVSDITYCTSQKTEKVIINAVATAPAAPMVGTIIQPATCSQTGSVVLTGLPAGNWTIAQHTEGESDLVYYYGSTSQYIVTGLSQGTYKFDVSDYTYCTSKKTDKVVIIALATAPPTPLVGTVTQATCSTSGSVLLTGLPSGNWTIAQHTAGQVGLVYYYGSTNQYLVTGLLAGTYKFDVSDVTYCTSKKTDNIVINPIDCALGVNKYDITGLEYYPNPVSDFVTITNANVITSINVFNLLGQRILSVSPNATTTKVDMSTLAIGTYLVQVQSEGKTATVKIVKNK